MFSLPLYRGAVGALLLALMPGVVPALAQTGTPIPRSNWSVHYVDSQDTDGGSYMASNAFDGNPATFWHTAWYFSSPAPPHELQIDLGGSYDVSGFRYLTRQDGVVNGSIGAYEFFVSADGQNWGPAVVSGHFPISFSEQQVVFAPKTGRYVRLRAVTEVLGQPWAAVAELHVLSGGSATPPPPPPPANDPGGTISRANWRIHFVNSQDVQGGNYAAGNAIDGNPGTFWHTEWYSSSPPPPHELQIDLGAVYDVSGFRYLTRQDGVVNGSIGAYQFFVSLDGQNWGQAVASGQFTNAFNEQQVAFAPKTGRYVRLRALSEVFGQPWAAVAELNVMGGGGSSEGGGGEGGSVPPRLTRVSFAPSADHDTLAQRYVVEVFAAGADPWSSTPVARLDVGLPPVSQGECTVDVAQLMAGLPAGSYFGVILVEGFGGAARSSPSAVFVVN